METRNPESSLLHLSERNKETIGRWVLQNPDLQSELNNLFVVVDKTEAFRMVDELNKKYLGDSEIEGMYTDINQTLANGMNLRVRRDDLGHMDFEIRA